MYLAILAQHSFTPWFIETEWYGDAVTWSCVPRNCRSELGALHKICVVGSSTVEVSTHWNSCQLSCYFFFPCMKIASRVGYIAVLHLQFWYKCAWALKRWQLDFLLWVLLHAMKSQRALINRRRVCTSCRGALRSRVLHCKSTVSHCCRVLFTWVLSGVLRVGGCSSSDA